MKLSAIFATAIFALSAYGAAVDGEHETHTLQARSCNIDNVCAGTGGGDLCNDRVRFLPRPFKQDTHISTVQEMQG